MSILREKILEIRKIEGLSQQEFCEVTGAGLSSIKALEAGRTDQLNTKTLLAITNHPRFKKYALWLVTDDEDSEQETPSTASDEFAKLLESLTDDQVDQVIQYMEFLLAKQK